MSGLPVSLRGAELRDFKQTDGDLSARFELSDGTRIEVRPALQSVLFLGHDPATGLPLYAVNLTPFFRIVSAGPGTRAEPPSKPSANPPGFG